MPSDNYHTIYKMQSEFCKTLTNPKRLEILHLLEKGEKSVTELANLTNLRQANVSQHLAVMRHVRIIKERRSGNNVYYSLAHPKITQACNMIRTILTEQLIKDVKSTTSSWNE
ncbi:ArsR/SmtB family transcription factor [[Eubacterium] cellulosolvens]